MAAADRPLRILVADAVSDAGVRVLTEAEGVEADVRTGLSPDELAAVVGDYDGLVVRSATKVTEAVLARPGRLRVIGRAGTGVDNIDTDAATRAGIVVMNTPGGNSVAAAELTLAHLLALARHLPQANGALREGRWERKRYVGTELAGKTLGVVGLGRIGREVAKRAAAFRMTVLGYDPFVSGDAVSGLGVTAVPLERLLADSDCVTLHLPRTDDTRHLIDAAALERMRPGALLVNCARGGLIDEEALLAALDEGGIGGAALDVFESEPPTDLRLARHPLVVATPHLGASTREAQERVGTEIAGKILDYLRDGTIRDAVNVPSIPPEKAAAMAPLLDLAERLGRFVAQIGEGGHRVISISAYGEYADHPLRPVVMAAVKGFLDPVLEGGASHVNALALAAERGITVDESRSSAATTYAGLLRIDLRTDAGTTTVAGTVYLPDGRPRLVEIDGTPIEIRPAGHMLVVRNRDVPGVFGRIGTILGEAGVNIGGIRLGRREGDDSAHSVIAVDSPVPAGALESIRAIAEVRSARSITV